MNCPFKFETSTSCGLWWPLLEQKENNWKTSSLHSKRAWTLLIPSSLMVQAAWAGSDV